LSSVLRCCEVVGVTADPDTVPVPDRRLVDEGLVRRLVASQFPQWADLPVRPVPTSDFGTCGVGDLAIAWTLLSGPSREAFRARLDSDPGTCARGRAWALWKALIVYAGALQGEPAVAAEAGRVIDEIIAEYATPAVWR
jgi:hypothetical protein